MEKQEVTIRKLMMDLGIDPHLKGYHYLIEAIKIIQKAFGRGDVYPPMMEVYGEIAEKFNTTRSRVERAIRHAKENVFDNPCVAHDEYFGFLIDFDSGNMPNKCFITVLAEHLQMGGGDERAV